MLLLLLLLGDGIGSSSSGGLTLRSVLVLLLRVGVVRPVGLVVGILVGVDVLHGCELSPAWIEGGEEEKVGHRRASCQLRQFDAAA